MNKNLTAYLQPDTKSNFFLLAGPCVVESEETTLTTAERLAEICCKLDIPLVFKSSFRKANRTRLDSFTGIGDLKALQILRKVTDTLGLPVVTDIHESHEAAMAAEYVRMLQIPAFLCRQTELLKAAAATGLYINIKKGQFMSPQSIQFAIEKVRDCGNDQVSVTDRGTMFGYNDLIMDFRAIPIIKEVCQCPVITDITHSLQQPNTTSGVTGGLPLLIETMARAAIASGANGLFMETHPDPANAKSDGANMLPLDKAEGMLRRLSILKKTINEIDQI